MKRKLNDMAGVGLKVSSFSILRIGLCQRPAFFNQLNKICYDTNKKRKSSY